ncbi:DUF3352 domain-containing protein [Phormidium sp. LEGE 05292]|uniref:DUF3352 domain-containing protein n=1 Tax=[Phormidium] sp. LEGE 05292 TaxID=767427 RepID=UPI001881B600|nr:DUF3352 domain-containing protein [Phormidium sp. LEGE 05292]MBE9229516.1 DUF3352 domain-containing protein [Phormidium sp. LEGE 05292]
MRKKNKSSLILTVAAIAAIINGGAAAYWVLIQEKYSGENLPVGAALIPQDALMALSVSTDERQWQQLREFGTSQSQAGFEQSLAKLRDRFLTANGYNYQQHIQPWLGKQVTLAFLSPPKKTSQGKLTKQITPATESENAESEAPEPEKQSVVMVLPIDNPLQAKQILEQPQSPFNKNQSTEREYQGVKIKETKVNEDESYSTAVIDGKILVISTDSRGIDRVIDTYKGGASLANTPGYNEALQKIADNRAFARLYVNIPAAAVAAKTAQQQLSPQGLEQIQQQQGLASNIILESQGIRFKNISWLKPNSQRRYQITNNAGEMPQLLPANTLMMVSGGNLKQFWQEYVQGVESNPMTPFKPTELRSAVKNFTGLDLDQDLVSWMGGEFSVSLIPAKQANQANEQFPSIGPGVVFMVKTSDRQTAEKNLAQLNSIMSDKYKFKAEKSRLGNQPVVNLVSPILGVKMSQGWLDGNVAFITLGAPITEEIVPRPKNNLTQNELFRSTVPSELTPNNGHFFIDIERMGVDTTANLLSFLLRLSPDITTQNNLRNQLSSMQAIGVTAAVSDERSSRFDIFVKLKKVREGGILPAPNVPAK